VDHCGNLPFLAKKGYAGPIYASHATAHLGGLMLSDSASIQEGEAEEVNRQQKKNGQQVKPLYNQNDVQRVIELFQCKPYNLEFEPVPGLITRLVDAGHILGSAGIVFDIEESNQKYRLWFSGDIGRLDLPLVRDPILPFNADYLVMESTYGDSDHPSPEQAYQTLKEKITAAIERRGKVIIPSFALGRAQELVYSLNVMMAEGEIPQVPVAVDSPLAVEASDIFRRHPEFFDKETIEFMKSGNSALNFEQLIYIRSADESRALQERDEPMVIISPSGMADNGRVQHHLAQNLGDPRSMVLLVSYQAPHTLGWELASGEKFVEIFGRSYEVKAEVARLRGFSSHAGQKMLVDYALAARNTLKGVYLVHGEARPTEALRKKLNSAGIEKVTIPYRKQVLELQD
jgi:metallo-beta-lactamase family protein